MPREISHSQQHSTSTQNVTPLSSRASRSASNSSNLTNLPSASVIQNAVSNSMRRLAQNQARLDESARMFPTVDDDLEQEGDSESPIIDSFSCTSGAGVFKAMTPLTRHEFELVWDEIGSQFASQYRNGRGRQPTVFPKDAFFILLCILYLPTTWDNHGVMFSMKGPRIEKLFWKTLSIAAPLLKKIYVRHVNKDDFSENDIQNCVNHPYVHHITDATVIQINTPSGDHSESKLYFSGKHKLYCLKIEASVYPSGEACQWTKVYPDSTADVTIFRKHLDYHKKSIRKSAAALAVVDHGENFRAHPKRYTILMDKGYIGVEQVIR